MMKLMTDKVFHLKPWTPKIQEVAQKLINEVHAAAPDLEVLFMGAAALGLPGKNDIDLDILCNQSDLTVYAQKLHPILGIPKDIDDKLAIWEFSYQGFDIDAILSDTSTSHVPEQREVFEILKTNLDLIDEYRQLKVSCDGLPYEIYEIRKKTFFRDRVLKS